MDPIAGAVMGEQNSPMTPPKDQAEFQQRVGLWQQFQEKIKSDPAARFALMQSAVHLMQPIQPGQSTLGHVGQAFGIGTNAYALANSQQEESARADAEMSMKQNESGAKVRQADAQTGLIGEQAKTEPVRRQTEQARGRKETADADFSEKSLARRLNKIQAEVDQTKNMSGYYNAMKTAKDLDNDIQRLFGKDEARAKIEREKAAAAASYASAAHQNALAAAAKTQMEAGKGWQTSAQNVDKETGVVTIAGTNRTTGENRIVRSIPPMQFTDAVQRAKLDIKSIDANTPGQIFGDSKERLAAYGRLAGEEVTSAADALQKISKRYQTGGASVTTFTKDGKISTVGLEDQNVSGTAQPAPRNQQPTAATIDPEVAAWTRANPGRVSKITMADGKVWQTDGRGGASIVNSSPSAPAGPGTNSNTSNVLARINVKNVDAARQYEEQDSQLAQLGTQLRLFNRTNTGATQSHAASLYQDYVARLKQLVGE